MAVRIAISGLGTIKLLGCREDCCENGISQWHSMLCEARQLQKIDLEDSCNDCPTKWRPNLDFDEVFYGPKVFIGSITLPERDLRPWRRDDEIEEALSNRVTLEVGCAEDGEI